MRKDFTASERVAIAEAVKAHEGNGHGGNRKDQENIHALDANEVAKKAGFGSKFTHLQARAVVNNGTPANDNYMIEHRKLA